MEQRQGIRVEKTAWAAPSGKPVEREEEDRAKATSQHNRPMLGSELGGGG